MGGCTMAASACAAGWMLHRTWLRPGVPGLGSCISGSRDRQRKIMCFAARMNQDLDCAYILAWGRQTNDITYAPTLRGFGCMFEKVFCTKKQTAIQAVCS